MGRKTVSVDFIRDRVNTALAFPGDNAVTPDTSPGEAFRLGMAAVLEAVLHETGNYRGFRYVERDFSDAIGPSGHVDYPERVKLGDMSRREYG